ncbi:hypothetical protein TRIATDRAFT_297829, partial [Trichoderma atroviride IMI 206040]
MTHCGNTLFQTNFNNTKRLDANNSSMAASDCKKQATAAAYSNDHHDCSVIFLHSYDVHSYFPDGIFVTQYSSPHMLLYFLH